MMEEHEKVILYKNVSIVLSNLHLVELMFFYTNSDSVPYVDFSHIIIRSELYCMCVNNLTHHLPKDMVDINMSLIKGKKYLE